MKKTHRALAALASFSLIAAACGSDDESVDTTPATEAPADTDAAEEPADTDAAEEPADTDAAEEPAADDGVARAEAELAPYLEPATEINPNIPLEQTPPEGKVVAWLQCEVTCAAFDPGFEQATQLLGWELEIIGVNSFDPAPGFQQALDLGADYIAITGSPPALYQDQLDAAAEAGIPVMSCYEITEPLQEENNIWTQCGDADNVRTVGRVLSNKIIVDSGGTAHELMVNVPDFPVLIAEREGAESAYADNCPDNCQFTELAVTLDQLGAGEVPGAVVSALQNDPSITHVRFAFDALATGVTSVLAEADLLDSVTVVGVDVNGAGLQEIIDGTMAYWTTNPVIYASFLMVDAMARHSIGQDNPQERENAILPAYFVDTPEKAQEIIEFGDWPGPEGQAEQFAALWGVG